MEKINFKFIQNKVNAGNDFYATSNPNLSYTGSYAKELKWIKDLTGGTWESIGNNLWKLIK